MTGIASLSKAVEGQSITDDAKLRACGRIQKHEMAFPWQLSVYSMTLTDASRGEI